MNSKITVDEANAWHFRNSNRLPCAITIDAVRKIKDDWMNGVKIDSVLEIGCSDGRNGHHMKDLAKNYTGIDPSPVAIKEGSDNGLNLISGWADTFKLNQKFDVIVLGFFLYLTSPTEWFKITNNIFEHLKPNSYIIIHDFYADELLEKVYRHESSVKIYKYNFNKLFTWHPSIKTIYQDISSENLNDPNNTDFWYNTTILKVTK